MDKKLQIHVLENISDHGGWQWSSDTNIVYNKPARLRFEQSDFEAVEYFRATVMLMRSGLVVEQHRITSTDNPWCLTVEGLDHLDYLKHPTRRWLQRNWFPVTVAAVTVAVSVAGIGVNVAVNLGR